MGEVCSKYWVTKSPGGLAGGMKSWLKSTGLSAGRGQINTKNVPKVIQNYFSFNMFSMRKHPNNLIKIYTYL